MFVEYIYTHTHEQYNSETACQNTSKLKHFISIEKTKHLSKQNSQPCYQRQKCFKDRKTCIPHGNTSFIYE